MALSIVYGLVWCECAQGVGGSSLPDPFHARALILPINTGFLHVIHLTYLPSSPTRQSKLCICFTLLP